MGVTLEIVLSRNLICWWQVLQQEIDGPPWNMIVAHRNGYALWAVRIALFLPYLAFVFYWMLKIGTDARTAGEVALLLLVLGILIWKRATP